MGIAGVRPGGAEPPAPRPSLGGSSAAGPSAELTQIISTTEQQGKTLDSISDSQANLLREVRSLQTVVNGLGRGGGIASAGAGQPAADPQLADKLRAATDSVNALSKRIEDQLAQVKADVQRVQSTLQAGVGGGGGGGGGGAGMGWVPYLMISFTTFCVASLTYHTFTQHMKNQRYKMI